MTRTVWLASYPKSGNTWFRLFIANLINPELAPVSFNAMKLATPIASSRQHFDQLLGVPSALLTQDEIDRMRGAADRQLAAGWGEDLLLRKAHDAYRLADGTALLGEAPDFAAIHILRDPWDVAPSLANHMSCTLDQAVEHLCDPGFALAKGSKGLNSQLRQHHGTWADHALSWLSAPMDVHVMRYEAMKADPVAVFAAAVRYLRLPHDEAAVAAALEACRFDRLQDQEAAERFREGPRDTQRFFRSGRVGEGLETLREDQLGRLRAMHVQVEAALAAREARA
jgi:hypothetical protein